MASSKLLKTGHPANPNLTVKNKINTRKNSIIVEAKRKIH